MAFAGIFSIAGVDVKSDLTSLRGSQRVGGVAAGSPPKSPELGMALFNVMGLLKVSEDLIEWCSSCGDGAAYAVARRFMLVVAYVACFVAGFAFLLNSRRTMLVRWCPFCQCQRPRKRLVRPVEAA